MFLFSVLCCHIIIKSKAHFFSLYAAVKREILMNNEPIIPPIQHIVPRHSKFKHAETENEHFSKKGTQYAMNYINIFH